MSSETAAAATDAFLLPLQDEESGAFWAGAAAGELRVQECGACGALRFPPRAMCPECQSTERTWRAVSGRGTIWSFVVVHPPVLPAYAPYTPYPVVTVTLAERPSLRMVGNLVTGAGGDINGVDPAGIEIGEAVRVVFSARTGPDGSQVCLPQWVRAPAS
ncbi:MAG TPA: OB-fold domain-containing protein [Acidimicrobiales bacterium]|jgi:hypothetical protein|nr:OB-fold domain-containing protein [Acidimicrobiales bacterium]